MISVLLSGSFTHFIILQLKPWYQGHCAVVITSDPLLISWPLWHRLHHDGDQRFSKPPRRTDHSGPCAFVHLILPVLSQVSVTTCNIARHYALDVADIITAYLYKHCTSIDEPLNLTCFSVSRINTYLTTWSGELWVPLVSASVWFTWLRAVEDFGTVKTG